MKKIFYFILLLFFYKKSGAQTIPVNNTVTQYIEGARIVIDILQLFKRGYNDKNIARPIYKGSYCNFCLLNSDSTQKIKVTLKSRNLFTNDTLVMVIKPGGKECSLQIKCGVYNCKIQSQDENIISWGDVLINEKEIFITK